MSRQFYALAGFSTRLAGEHWCGRSPCMDWIDARYCSRRHWVRGMAKRVGEAAFVLIPEDRQGLMMPLPLCLFFRDY